MLRALVGLAVVCPGLMACGGMSEEDARKALMSMLVSTGSATGQAQAQYGSALTVDRSVELSVNCLAGGTLQLSGTLHVDDNEGAGGGNLAFDYSATFDKCSHLGQIFATGALQHALAVSGDGAGTGSLAWSYKGTLEFTGDVEGECEIDLSVTASGTAGVGGSFQYQGKMCGHEASSRWAASR